jgi:hypothetical protein
MALSWRPLAAVSIALVLVSGCGSTEKTGASQSADTSMTTDAVAPTDPTAPPAPTYRLLSEQELAGAVLGIEDLPPGYSQDPPSDDSTNKTFCDYTPPFEEQIKVRQDFTKGGGISAEVLSVGLRQYASPEEASASFDALMNALAYCPGETYEGTELTYAAMSAPKVGDASVGVRISADGTDLLQTFALVGPTLVNTGGGGLMNASADDVNTLLEAQVNAYKAAASA